MIENVGTEDCFVQTSMLDIESAEGDLITTINLVDAWPRWLSPGESSFVALSVDLSAKGVETLQEIGHPVLHYEISAISNLLEKPDYSGFEVIQSDIIVDTRGVSVKVRVKNNTSRDESMLHIVSVIRDQRGTLLTAKHHVVQNVTAGNKVGYEVMLPDSDFRDNYTQTVLETFFCM